MPEFWSPEEEARRLAERFVGVNQAEFARLHKVGGGKSMVSQHIKGRRPISHEAAIAYAQGFNVPLREISPRIASIIEGAIERGLVGEPKMDLQLAQIKLLLEKATDRDAAFLVVTEALTRHLIGR